MQWIKRVGQSFGTGVEEVVGDIDNRVENLMRATDSIVEPIRQSAFKRFPTMFLLLVTFGVSAVVYAFERLITLNPYLNDHPWFILAVGVVVLALTGRLYKKLD